MEFLVVLVVLVVVVAVLIMPLRRGASERAEARESAELRELEAERASRYAEIRDAELDFRTGKLSEKDYRTVDRALRAEAVDILRRIDNAGGGRPASSREAEEAPEPELAAEEEPELRPALRAEHES